MPIRQLKRKSSGSGKSSFSSHSFGSSSSRKSQFSSRGNSSRPQSTRTSFSHSSPKSLNRSRNTIPTRRKPDAASSALKKKFFWLLVKGGLIISVVGVIGVATMFVVYSRDLPDPNKIIDRDLAQSTKIYDRTGEVLLYEIHGTERRTLIELSDIPDHVINAAISIEDKNFYTHRGVSLPHIAKAVVLEVLQKIGLYRKNVPGGSTLTQQFIKNAVLTTEKSYERKMKELVLAYRLEQKFTKDDILKLYFNEIPYGSTAYGVEAAAGIYFDKSVQDLSIAEGAILAAMTQAPSYYSPYGSHVDELIGRQQYVLDLMAEQGYITEEQAETAKREEVNFKRRREDITAPHFVFMVREQLAARYGERLVETGGLKIITTIDAEKQKLAEEIIEEKAEASFEEWEAQNASLVSIDVATGEILALVGSRDFFNDDIDGQVNVATSLRQPGSSLKPMIYAESFNQGYRPETTVYDVVTNFAAAGQSYAPNNYDLSEYGPIDLRHALQGSKNIPAVKMLYLIGVDRAIELAQELGYTSLIDPEQYGLSLVLGGGEVRLLEHTNAYAAFAREGIFKPYVSVLRVEQSDGTVLEEHEDTEGKRVLPKEVTRTLTNVLSDNEARVYAFGANTAMNLSGRPAAAKTGTTNDYRDAWTLGYTPSVVTGVWVGNSDNQAMRRGASGGRLAAPIWQKYMNTVLNATPVQGFAAPETPEPCTKPMVCGGTGEQILKINVETGKIASEFTPPSKIREMRFQEVHSILHYVNPDDPLGPAPEDPSSNPQYALWEEPILKWAEEQEIETSNAPTEIDDAYRPEDQPNIAFISPSTNQTITNQSTQLQVSANARRGVRSVTYYIDNILIGQSDTAPFDYTFTVSPIIPNGSYRLRAIARDDIGNESEASIPIGIDVERSGQDWSVTWNTPTRGQSFLPDEAPENLSIAISKPEQLQKIDFYYTKDNARQFIGVQSVGDKSTITQNWNPPSTPGDYSIVLIITDVQSRTFTYPALPISILEPSEEDEE